MAEAKTETKDKSVTPASDDKTEETTTIPDTTSTEPKDQDAKDEIGEEVKAEVEKVEEKVKDSYIVIAHVLGGFDMQRGMRAFEDELGGLKNVERLLKNKSIAVSTSEEAVRAQQEFLVADAAIQRAKERGN